MSGAEQRLHAGAAAVAREPARRRRGWVAPATAAHEEEDVVFAAASRVSSDENLPPQPDDPNLAARCERRARLMEAKLNGIARQTGNCH